MASITAQPPLTTNLGWMLAQASHVLNTELHAAFADLGFAPRGYCVLASAIDGEYTQKELADLIGLDKTTMVVTLDALEQAGLAERKPSPKYRRARIIGVTEAGRQALEQGEVAQREVQDAVLAALPEEDREVFMDTLSRLVCDRLSTPAACDRAPRRRN